MCKAYPGMQCVVLLQEAALRIHRRHNIIIIISAGPRDHAHRFFVYHSTQRRLVGLFE